MKILVLSVGKVREPFLERAILSYLSRMTSTYKISWECVPEIRGESRKEIVLEKESLLLKKAIRDRDRCVLLDERGRHFRSTEFAEWLQYEIASCQGRLVFIVGGPFGVSERIRSQATHCIALSQMTFPHDLCVLFLMEQLYRAFSILAGTAYHH